MSLNDTPMANRIQIGFFGKTNVGKSSLINAVTNQNIAIVSPEKGTTTDPVIKTMELLPAGPVALIDTAGLDDSGNIGKLRIEKSLEMLKRVDMAVIVSNSQDSEDEMTTELISICEKRKIPFIIALNMSDKIDDKNKISRYFSYDKRRVFTSAQTGEGIEELKEKIAKTAENIKKSKEERKLVSDIVGKCDNVILVIPIDESAPKGRLILPQQQVIRDIIESGGNAVCVRDTELKELFDNNPSWSDSKSKGNMKPSLVITDSQVFKEVNEIVPEHIPLTSFSILMARYKGALSTQVQGAFLIDSLKDGDYVLIAEGCTHHRQCEDIGTVKLPRLIKKYTGKDINIETSSGHGYPQNLKKYALIFHCGACVLGEAELKNRVNEAVSAEVPITNYGISIAYMTGILKRSLEPLPEF